MCPTRTPIDVLSNVLSQYMEASTHNTPTNQRKSMIDRHCGQSLTSIEIFAQLEKKEKTKQRKRRAPAKPTTTSSDVKRKR